MSISACFAGPLINLLITLGVSGILGMGKAPIMLSRDVEVVFIYSGLLFMVIITLFVVLARKFRLHRSMGYVLLILYAVVFGITVMLDRIK